MTMIYCGKSSDTSYYIKEADLYINSIQQLSYFIYEYAVLISNNFISKSLIKYISKQLNYTNLASNINEMYNKNENLINILTYILLNSNYYTEEEVVVFRRKILDLLSMPEEKYILLAGDSLFKLKKYEKAISQYSKIIKQNDKALMRIAFCYAKLQFYDMAVTYLKMLYSKNHSVNVLKYAYYCLKLNGETERIQEFDTHIDESLLADWELDMVKEIIQVRSSDVMKEKTDIFLMGTARIKEKCSDLIKIWKEKYRYIG